MNRDELHRLVGAIAPHDEHEARDKQDALDWVASGSPLYRIQKPDVPPKHLVSYFAIIDPKSKKILLQDHLLAKLWLPAGGHVEPSEDPAEAALRECEEELGFMPGFLANRREPHFITVTTTNGQGEHTDVSLWYALEADESTPLVIEPGKFADVRWWEIDEVLKSPIALFDPEIHRFIHKLQSAALV